MQDILILVEKTLQYFSFMIGHLPSQNQKDLFTPLLRDFIDMKHELVLLADRIDWSSIEQELSGYYSHTGQKSMPIRVMVSFLLFRITSQRREQKSFEF